MAKYVKITNAEVVMPSRNAKQLVGIFPSKNEDSNLTMITFTLKIKTQDKPEVTKVLYSKCVIRTNNQDLINTCKNLKVGTLVNAEGYDDRNCAKDGVWYDNTVLTKLIPISVDVEQPTMGKNPLTKIKEEDLPF